MAPPNYTSRSVAGADESIIDPVVFHDEKCYAVLKEDEVDSILEEVATFLNDWRTQIDLARGTPEAIGVLRQILADNGSVGEFYTKTVKGVKYHVLKSYSGLRTIFAGTKTLGEKTKIISHGIKQHGTVAAKGAGKGSIISIFILTAFNVLETIMSEDKDFIDGSAQFTTDVAKTIIGSVIGVAVGAGLSAMAAPAVVTIGAGLAVGVIVALVLDEIDARWEITKSLEQWYRKAYEESKKSYEEIKYEFEINIRWCNSPEGAYDCMRRMFGGF